MAPSMATCSLSVSSRFLCRHCEPATSSSWTISAPTRLPECAKRSAAGASLLFLPPDSPDLNPIEQAFAKLKALLRAKNSERSRHSGMLSGRCPTASLQRNAPIRRNCGRLTLVIPVKAYLRTSGYFRPMIMWCGASAPLTLLGWPACRWLDRLTLPNRSAAHCFGSDRLSDQANIAAVQAASL